MRDSPAARNLNWCALGCEVVSRERTIGLTSDAFAAIVTEVDAEEIERRPVQHGHRLAPSQFPYVQLRRPDGKELTITAELQRIPDARTRKLRDLHVSRHLANADGPLSVRSGVVFQVAVKIDVFSSGRRARPPLAQA